MCFILIRFINFYNDYFSDASKDPIARKLRLRRGRRDTENSADQDQAKILKVVISFSVSFTTE